MVFGTSFTRFALNHLITKAHIWMEIKLSWNENENEDIYGWKKWKRILMCNTMMQAS